MSILAGGVTYPAVKFQHPGESVVGRIIEFKDVPENDYNTKLPKWWGENGKPVALPAEEAQARNLRPVEQCKVTLETRPGDQASRVNLYISGQRMVRAVRQALAAKGANDLSVMSDLSVTYTGNEGMAKVYAANYEPFDPTA